MADEVVVDWPHRLLERGRRQTRPADAVCVLTHDAKFDVPAIVAALATDVGYLGAMGSRRTHDDAASSGCARRASTTPASPGIMAPIGLDIGARTPEETAVSICAEIIALRNWSRPATSRPCRDTDRPDSPVTHCGRRARRGRRGRVRGADTHKLLAPFRGRPLWAWAVEHAAWPRARRDLRRHRGGRAPRVDGAGGHGRSQPSGRPGRPPRSRAGVRHAAGAAATTPSSSASATSRSSARAVAAVAASHGDRRSPLPSFGGERGHPVRLAAEVWPLLPTAGDDGARVADARAARPRRRGTVPGEPVDIDTLEDLRRWS